MKIIPSLKEIILVYIHLRTQLRSFVTSFPSCLSRCFINILCMLATVPYVGNYLSKLICILLNFFLMITEYRATFNNAMHFLFRSPDQLEN